jgi:hypothetical protein
MFLSETAPTMPHISQSFNLNVAGSYASYNEISLNFIHLNEFIFHELIDLNYYFFNLIYLKLIASP